MFEDRSDAGRRLAAYLGHHAEDAPLVLGLPRGGVVVAAEIARSLAAPLDVLVVRKLGAPGQPELAIGAVIDGDPPRRVLNVELVERLGVPRSYIDRLAEQEVAAARERVELYRRDRPASVLAGRTVIVVDDGVATGATVRVALESLAAGAAADPSRLVLAVPVAAAEVLAELDQWADEIVCLETPRRLRAVGNHYRDFEPTPDDEVIALLDEAAARVEPDRP